MNGELGPQAEPEGQQRDTLDLTCRSRDAGGLVETPVDLKDEVWVLVENVTGSINIAAPRRFRMRFPELAKRFDLDSSFRISCRRVPANRIESLLLDWFHAYHLPSSRESKSSAWFGASALSEIAAFVTEHGERLGLARLIWDSAEVACAIERAGTSHQLVPMLHAPRIYRRHTGACVAGRSQHDKEFTRCDCVIHIEGAISPGNSVRESLHIREWSKAQELIAGALKKGYWPKRDCLGSGEISVKAAIENFLANYRGRGNIGLKQSTTDRYRATLWRFADSLDIRGDFPLSDLSDDAVENWIRSGSGDGRLNTNLASCLRAFFGFCVDQKWIAARPPIPIPPSKQRQVVSRKPFSDEEVHRFLDAAREASQREYAFVLVLLHTGLWIGDAVMLRKSNLKEATLTLTKIKGQNPVTIPLPPELESELSRITPEREDFLFFSGNSDRLATASDLWRRKMSAIADRAGISDADPRRFRHTFAAVLFRSEVDLATISSVLGHQSPTVTAKLYEDEFRASRDRQSSRLKRSLESAISKASWQLPMMTALVDKVESASTAAEKGKSLEALCRRLFETIPGFKVEERVSNGTEEFDLVIHNSNDEGYLRREQFVILVECKNWSSKCGKDEYILLYEKVKNRHRRCSLAFLISWNGFKSNLRETERRHSRDEVLILQITGSEIRDAIESKNFGAMLLASYNKATID